MAEWVCQFIQDQRTAYTTAKIVICVNYLVIDESDFSLYKGVDVCDARSSKLERFIVSVYIAMLHFTCDDRL